MTSHLLFWLQITMNNLKLVTILNSADDLLEETSSFCFRHLYGRIHANISVLSIYEDADRTTISLPDLV